MGGLIYNLHVLLQGCVPKTIFVVMIVLIFVCKLVMVDYSCLVVLSNSPLSLLLDRSQLWCWW
jgi:hypothetical protein